MYDAAPDLDLHEVVDVLIILGIEAEGTLRYSGVICIEDLIGRKSCL